MSNDNTPIYSGNPEFDRDPDYAAFAAAFIEFYTADVIEHRGEYETALQPLMDNDPAVRDCWNHVTEENDPDLPAVQQRMMKYLYSFVMSRLPESVRALEARWMNKQIDNLWRSNGFPPEGHIQ